MKLNEVAVAVDGMVYGGKDTDTAVREMLEQAGGLTVGMLNFLGKDPKHVCLNCGFPIPRYPGRYPTNCPQCGSILDYSAPGDVSTTGEEL